MKELEIKKPWAVWPTGRIEERDVYHPLEYAWDYDGADDLPICFRNLREQLQSDPESVSTDTKLSKSLKGAYLYASDAYTKQMEGAELILEAAKDECPIGMREYAVVLLEGLVCDRNPEIACKWLHLAARYGDKKALRILVYSMFGVEKLVAVPRKETLAGDSQGRTILISDLFNDMEITDKDRLVYLKLLIELSGVRRPSGKIGIRHAPTSLDRRFMGLLFGYILLAKKIDPDLLLEKWFVEYRFDKKFLLEAIEKEPLYDGVVIKNKMTSDEQMKVVNDLYEQLDKKKKELEKAKKKAEELKKENIHPEIVDEETGELTEFPPLFQGRYNDYDLYDSSSICNASRAELIHWTLAKGSGWLSCNHRVNPHSLVYCARTLVRRALNKGQDICNIKERNRLIEAITLIIQMKNVRESKFNCLEGFRDSNDYKYILKEEQDIFELIDSSPNRDEIYYDLCKHFNYSPLKEKAVHILIDKYCDNYNADEIAGLKDEIEKNALPREASFLLGLRYERGLGTDPDWENAAKCFKDGNGGLFSDQCKIHLEKIESSMEDFNDLKNSLNLLRTDQAATGGEEIDKLVKKGFDLAMYLVAKQKMELDPDIAEQNYYDLDFEGGITLLKKAAEKGSISAICELVRLYKYGVATSRGGYIYLDKVEANKYRDILQRIIKEELGVVETSNRAYSIAELFLSMEWKYDIKAGEFKWQSVEPGSKYIEVNDGEDYISSSSSLLDLFASSGGSSSYIDDDDYPCSNNNSDYNSYDDDPGYGTYEEDTGGSYGNNSNSSNSGEYDDFSDYWHANNGWEKGLSGNAEEDQWHYR
ncbi:MAG: hypothetical protein IJ195_04955 [Lachnospiraceae bacterium]|nr:hypothetical protein [Lachnospiraceae bacterium]